MKSALVTGGGNGIGAATAARLAERGYSVTVSDIDAAAAERVAASLRARGLEAASAACDVRDEGAQRRLFAKHAAEHSGNPPDFVFLNAGIIDRVALLDDAERKWETTLDVNLRAVLVGVTIAAAEAEKKKKKKQQTMMIKSEDDSKKEPPPSSTMSIVVVASAGGLYPMPTAPVYAASKAGLVQFVRSAARGIRERTGATLTALCPEQVDTALVAGFSRAGLLPPNMSTRTTATATTATATTNGKAGAGSVQRKLQQLLSTDDVADAAVALGENVDAAPAGTCLFVHVSGRLLEARMPRGFLVDTAGKFSLKNDASASSSSSSSSSPSSSSSALASWAKSVPPSSNRAVVVERPGVDFRAATRVVSRPLPLPLPTSPSPSLSPSPSPSPSPGASIIPPGFLLVRRTYAGVNASDVNYAAGRYASAPRAASAGNNNKQQPPQPQSVPGARGASPPFPSGFEAVGVVAAVGPGETAGGWREGDAVAELCYDGFAEFSLVRADRALKVNRPDAAAVALLTSGLTASIGLEVAAKVKKGDVVVVTAAAGGTGQFVVQLAAAAGCRVVATCGGPAKAAMLRGLGAERVVDYKSEDVDSVLKKEFPGGVDVVWESVGGAMFDACARSLKPVTGRIVVIGMMQEYKAEAWQRGEAGAAGKGLPELLLWRGATCTGFFLLHHLSRAPRHLASLERKLEARKLRVAVDDGRGRGGGSASRFVGVDGVADAVEYLQSGASSGKVVVRLAADAPVEERGVWPGQGGASRL